VWHDKDDVNMSANLESRKPETELAHMFKLYCAVVQIVMLFCLSPALDSVTVRSEVNSEVL